MPVEGVRSGRQPNRVAERQILDSREHPFARFPRILKLQFSGDFNMVLAWPGIVSGSHEDDER